MCTSMSRKQLALLSALALVAALVLVLALRTRRPPFLPNDEAHASGTAVEACLSCHGPEGPSPRSQNHPLGRDCLRCHGVRGG